MSRSPTSTDRARTDSTRRPRPTRPASWCGARTPPRARRTRTTTGCARRRGEVIVIDPIRTPSGAQADAYLQLRPGSDAALAFALAHVIRREGLVDEAFVRRARARLRRARAAARAVHAGLGRGADGRAGEPHRARRARLRARAVAALDGPGPAAPAARRQRHARDRDAARADRQHPPSRLGLPLPQRRRIARDRLRLARGIRPRSGRTRPRAISQMDLAAVLADPDRSRALVCWNINPVASNPRAGRAARGAARARIC